VRALSTALKINPNTAHKVVTHLLNEGLIEVMPGIGTVVAEPPAASAAQRARLLNRELEKVVVQAKGLGLSLDRVRDALTAHWERLGPGEEPPSETDGNERSKQ